MSDRVRNEQVIRAWHNSNIANSHTGHLTSSGDELRSYELLIGFTTLQGSKIALDYTAPAGHFRSQTTSTHCGRAKAVSDVVISPSVAQGLEAFKVAEIPF
jgi:hypothetical protein